MQAEVVIEGVLELGKKPTSTVRKDWKPRLFVLKWYTTTDRSTLDYYKDTKKRWQKQEAVGVVSLWPTFEVSLAHSCPYKFTIQLQTAESLLYLACDTEDVMMQWLNQIQMQRRLSPKPDIYVYPARIQDNVHSRLVGMKEECSLAISAKEILCVLPTSNEVMGVWPLGTLRRYWCEDGVFGFEAGRHSPRGEGTYLFTTKQDKEIYDMLKRLTTQGDTAALGTRPPAPLPPVPFPLAPLSTKSTTPSADPIRGGVSIDRKEFKDDDEKKYDIVVEPLPVLPPKPLPKSQAEISVHKPMLSEPSLDLSPAYGHATPPVLSSNASSSVVPNALYGSSVSVAPLANNQATPNNQTTPNNETMPNNNQTTPNTLKRRYLHESITPKVEPGEPPKDSLLQFGTSILKVSKWVQSTQAQAPAGVLQHGSSGTAGVSEGSVYAHTVHRMPVEFELAEGPSVTLGPTLYNTLVHKGVQPHPRQGSPTPSVHDQQRLYDIAFTQSGSNSRPSSRGDYSVAYLPQDQVDGAAIAPQPMAVKEKGGGTPRCSPPPVAPLAVLPLDKGGQLQDDGLTTNPLYGSQNTVIREVLSLNISTPELHKKLGVLQDGPIEEASFPGNSNGTESMPSGGDEGVAGDLPLDPTKGDSGETIQRDSKGYSKVAKTNLDGVNDDAVPPLPERHYD